MVEEREVDDYQHISTYNEKERLQKLEDSYQNRMITKDEYEKKRKDIIDQL